MDTGNIAEYIDQQRVVCAVVTQLKNLRLKLLTENNREVNLATGRLAHISREGLNPSASRESLVRELKLISQKRRNLAQTLDVEELWELLHEDGDPIDIPTMTALCFDPPVTPDHESAVIRAFFNDKLYFKFGKDVVTPNTPEHIELKLKQIQEAEARKRLMEKGGAWVKGMDQGTTTEAPDPEIIKILTDYYIHEGESKTATDAKAILSRAGTESPQKIFNIMVKAGIWRKNENLDLIRLDIPTCFPSPVMERADGLISNHEDFIHDPLRKDLREVPLITIDGQSTLDYDDAISLQKKEDGGYLLGIHIIDVGFYIKDDDVIDKDARSRASSIYMPDDKIPMLPPNLSEDLCSLREGETRPGISTLVNLNRFFELIDYEVTASIIKVHHQMTYTEANMLNGEDDPITTLHKIATVLREKRIKAGAVQITLPEVNLWVEDNGDIGISRIDRENPSRMLVSEMMILANSLMAEFLASHETPAVFRSQPEPKQRLFQGVETSLFMNCMQRKQLNRAATGTKPAPHSGLGVKAYSTATSPIRRYVDLLTQRQIRGILGYETAYTKNELNSILQMLDIPMANTGRAQFQRRRYWLLKYLEGMKGSSQEAVVLDSRRDFFTVLIKEFMLEWRLPSGGMKLKPGDLVQVTIQHADARRDQLSLFSY